MQDIDSNNDLSLYFLDVSIELINNNYNISTTTVIKNSDPDITTSHYKIKERSCDPDCNESVFENGNSFYVGLAGLGSFGEPDLIPSLPVACPDDCGSTQAEELSETNAIEEMQNHINATNCIPDCPPDFLWDGTYSNITSFDGTIEWNWDDVNAWEYPIFEDCLSDYILNICDCLNSNTLNCIYSVLCQARENLEFPFEINIPDGHILIHTNLGVDFVDFTGNNNPLEYHTALWVSNTYALPTRIEVIPQQILTLGLDMDLDLWE